MQTIYKEDYRWIDEPTNINYPTWKALISPARIELAISSATVKHIETHPLSATNTIFAIQRVIFHGIAMACKTSFFQLKIVAPNKQISNEAC